MIASLTGELKSVYEDRVHLQAGSLLYDLMVPAADIPLLQTQVGQELTLHTIFYLQGDANGGYIEPRLIGFLRPEDKRFFEKFVTVKGIGPKTALRALTVTVGEIASAIESKNIRFLVGLNGIGKRTAELMVAELAGKVGAFATTATGSASAVASTRRRWNAEEEAALAFAMSPQIGLRLADAERLLERVKSTNEKLQTAEQILPEMLRLHSARM